MAFQRGVMQPTSNLAARIAAPPAPAPGWPAQSLIPPPMYTDPRYTENGTSQVPPAAIQVASMTGSAVGGSGATFGPPGVGGAPVTLGGFQLTPLGLAVLVGVGGFVAWRLLR